MKLSSLTFLIILFFTKAFSQKNHNSDYLSWSSSRKLTLDDFVIKANNLPGSSSFAQFSMQFEIGGFAFMTKNFNKKVHNYFIRSASWIDTTYDVGVSLRYQQTLFDICEIYTRKFRKDLKENRRHILKGTDKVNELNAKAMANFSKRRIEYDTETKAGTDSIKQSEWETQIQKELNELKEFAVEE